jgi:hypothetical protein
MAARQTKLGGIRAGGGYRKRAEHKELHPKERIADQAAQDGGSLRFALSEEKS